MTDAAEFDHAIILHDALDLAVAALDRVGFRPTPPGYHGDARGTENVTIVLPDRQTYFEILVVRKPGPANAGNVEALAARGPHLYGMALKGDAHMRAAAFDVLGVTGEGPFEFSRTVDLPSGPREASFTVTSLAPGTLPGLYGFVCQHHTPDVVWRDDYLAQPNGAEGIIGLWGVAADPVAVTEGWRRLFGRAVGETDEGFEVTLGEATVRYCRPAIWADRFGPLAHNPGKAGLLALEFRIADRAALELLLSENAVAFESTDEHIVVPDGLGLGAMLLFREMPGR